MPWSFHPSRMDLLAGVSDEPSILRVFNFIFFLESIMSNVSPTNTGGGAEAGLAKMEAAFDRAIEMSAKVTEITTEKKAELDASKQRPN